MGVGGMIREFFLFCPKCGEDMDKKFGYVSRCYVDGSWHNYYYYKCPKCYYRGNFFRNDNGPCGCLK